MKKCKCIFCENEFNSFLDHGIELEVFKKYKIIGGGKRKNARCPKCNSIDRDRLVYSYLKEKTEIFNKKLRVLHFAPEVKIFNILKKLDNLEYFTCDINSKLAMMKVDIISLPFKDNYFDIIICNHVLEHIIDDIKAMKELYRILNKDGISILQVPISIILEKTFEDSSIISEIEREKVFGQKDHVRIYGIDYKDRLKNVGFNVNIFNYEKEYGLDNRLKYGISENENIYVCKK